MRSFLDLRARSLFVSLSLLTIAGAPGDERPAGRVMEGVLRELLPQVLGVIARRFGDFAAAEDAVQEALMAAVAQWPLQGLPDSPRAWLISVAARRMTDRLRADLARRRREIDAAETAGGAGTEEQDDSLISLEWLVRQDRGRSGAERQRR